MKKLIASLLAITLMLTAWGCSKKPADQNVDDSNDNQTQQGGTPSKEEEKKPETQKLTVESVKAAEETSAADFEYSVEDDGVVITGYKGKGGVLVIPEKIEGTNVVRIRISAFVNFDTITAVRISDTVLEVEDHAFENCSSMEIFISGKSVKRLGEYALNGCNDLKTVELNDGLEVLDVLCFGFAKLTKIEVPDSVKEIQAAFRGESSDKPLVVIGTPGSYAEQYVNEKGAKAHMIFQAK